MSDACCGFGLCTKKATWLSGHAAFCDEHKPDLSSRKAHCTYGCGESAASDNPNLAFFEYQGAGSFSAGLCKHCGYAKNPHEGQPFGRPNVVDAGLCPGYEARGDIGSDRFYCGCRGWD